MKKKERAAGLPKFWRLDFHSRVRTRPAKLTTPGRSGLFADQLFDSHTGIPDRYSDINILTFPTDNQSMYVGNCRPTV